MLIPVPKQWSKQLRISFNFSCFRIPGKEKKKNKKNKPTQWINELKMDRVARKRDRIQAKRILPTIGS